MSNYNIKTRVETITKNTRLNDKKFGAWLAVNIGTADCTVLGITLAPSEGLDFTHAVPAGSYWTDPIDITVQAGGAIRLVRLMYEKRDDGIGDDEA